MMLKQRVTSDSLYGGTPAVQRHMTTNLSLAAVHASLYRWELQWYGEGLPTLDDIAVRLSSIIFHEFRATSPIGTFETRNPLRVVNGPAHHELFFLTPWPSCSTIDITIPHRANVWNFPYHQYMLLVLDILYDARPDLYYTHHAFITIVPTRVYLISNNPIHFHHKMGAVVRPLRRHRHGATAYTVYLPDTYRRTCTDYLYIGIVRTCTDCRHTSFHECLPARMFESLTYSHHLAFHVYFHEAVLDLAQSYTSTTPLPVRSVVRRSTSPQPSSTWLPHASNTNQLTSCGPICVLPPVSRQRPESMACALLVPSSLASVAIAVSSNTVR